MKLTSINSILLLLLTLFVVGCSTKTSNPVEPISTIVSKTGRFAISYADGMAKTATSSTDSVYFDLGDLRGSKSFYFILENVGSTNIDSITLSSSDSSIDVTPSTISVLTPQGQSGILQTVKVTINHGTVLENGVGSKPLQPMGELFKYLNIQGKSADTTINLNLKMRLYSYVMNISMYSDSENIDFYNPVNVGYSFLSVPAYYYKTIDSVWTVKNTGNVPIYFNRYSLIIPSQLDTAYAIGVGDSLVLNLGVQNSTQNFGINDYTGTVANESKFTQDSRTGYFIFQLWGSD